MVGQASSLSGHSQASIIFNFSIYTIPFEFCRLINGFSGGRRPDRAHVCRTGFIANIPSGNCSVLVFRSHLPLAASRGLAADFFIRPEIILPEDTRPPTRCMDLRLLSDGKRCNRSWEAPHKIGGPGLPPTRTGIQDREYRHAVCKRISIMNFLAAHHTNYIPFNVSGTRRHYSRTIFSPVVLLSL